MFTLILILTMLFGNGGKSINDYIQEVIDNHPEEDLTNNDFPTYQILICALFMDLCICGIIYGAIKLLEFLL